MCFNWCVDVQIVFPKSVEVVLKRVDLVCGVDRVGDEYKH